MTVEGEPCPAPGLRFGGRSRRVRTDELRRHLAPDAGLVELGRSAHDALSVEAEERVPEIVAVVGGHDHVVGCEANDFLPQQQFHVGVAVAAHAEVEHLPAP